MVALSPLAFYLQTLTPIPALPSKTDEEIIADDKIQEVDQAEISQQEDVSPQDEIDYRPLEDISAPDIQTALREALSSPTFIFITLGFGVCGFHIAFLSTHFPAYLVCIITMLFLYLYSLYILTR